MTECSIIKDLTHFPYATLLFEVKIPTLTQNWTWPIITIENILEGPLSEVDYSSIGHSPTVSTWQSHHFSSITLCPLLLHIMPLRPLSRVFMENDMLAGSSVWAEPQWTLTGHNEMKGWVGQGEVLIFALILTNRSTCLEGVYISTSFNEKKQEIREKPQTALQNCQER